jgi:hypothetical protein
MITISCPFGPIQIELDDKRPKNWRNIQSFLQINRQTLFAHADFLSARIGIQKPTSSIDCSAPLSPSLHHEDDPWTIQQPIADVIHGDASPFAEYVISWGNWSQADDEHSLVMPDDDPLFES